MIEKFRGPEYIMHRCEQNPIITLEDFPVPARAVFNCGQTMYNGQTILLVAAIYQDRNSRQIQSPGRPRYEGNCRAYVGND